jgi:kumamolisin
MKWISLSALFLAVCTARGQVGQTDLKKFVGRQTPPQVLEGTARLVEHYSPNQLLGLVFAIQPPHMAEEEQFLKELQTKGSPNFHHFLTSEEWDSRFAPSVADEQAVVDWAQSQGFTVTHRFRNRLLVDVEAPVGTIEKALGVTINRYQVGAETLFSNDRDPVMPPNLAGIVYSVQGLNNIQRMHPALRGTHDFPGPDYTPGPVYAVGPGLRGDGNRSKLLASLGGSKSNATPNISNGAYDPSDIYSSQAYDYNALYALGHCCNPNNYTGGSPPETSIAIAAFGVASGTDLSAFFSHYGLAYNIYFIYIDGTYTCGTPPDDNCVEASMDTEWSTATSNSFGSAADTAAVYLYMGYNENNKTHTDMYNQMEEDGNARVFSTSWSCTEIYSCDTGTMDSNHNIFNKMVGEGWTLVAASGDRGASDDCDFNNPAHTSVSYPASDPDVVGAGGTSLFFTDSTFSSEVAWQGSFWSGACSQNHGGSGGGISAYYTSDEAPYQKLPSGDYRQVPDLSLNASSGQNIYYNGGFSGEGGTSIVAPELAGFFAQENAYLLYVGDIIGATCGSGVACAPMGNANYYLYYEGLNAPYAAHYPFYDITSGCNSNDATVADSLAYFCAGTGYDEVTGWGTANMLQLAWAINTYLAGDFGAPDVNFSGSPTTSTWYKTNQTVQWSITDTSADPSYLPNGVAGYSAAWDTLPTDSYSKPTPGSGDSFYTGPQTPNPTTGSLSGSLTLDSSHEGCHTAHVRAWDNAGATGDNTYGPVCYDDIPPVVNCGSPDGNWHASNVSIACAASDSLSGLAVPADANFNLTTTVSAGTETSSAYTGSLGVSDVAGNSTTAGPIGPNKVDRKPPTIIINQPAATTYTHSSTLTLNYTVNDYGSGVHSFTPTMNGSTTVGGGGLSSGTAINLLTELPLGPNTFKISATDNVGNSDSPSVTFTIIVTPQSIINDVNEFVASHGMSRDVGAVLLGELEGAMRPYNAGQCRPADIMYSTFISTVQFMTQARGITARDASILVADARYLISHCP